MNYTFDNSSIVSVNSGTIVLNVSGKTRTFADAKLVSAVAGEIVLDLPKHAKENGSYLVIRIDDKIERIFIVNQYRDCRIDYHVSQRHGTIIYNQRWIDNSSIRNATPEEIQELDDQLAAAGKQWNPATMQIEKLKWKPIKGQIYYYVALEVIPYISFHIWRDDGVDDQHYQSKNCFKTEEGAMLLMEKIKKVLSEN